jgi:GH15 family glucan-1,4-alpha-glucosidase
VTDLIECSPPVTTTDRRAQSIAVILSGQSLDGGYVASPTFKTYGYSWLRDGAFIGYAMDRVGQHASSARFHDWAAGVVLRYRPKALSAVSRGLAGLPPIDGYLHCRYTLDGREGQEGWPNYQLDGYGAWLWGLAEHLRMSGRHLSDDLAAAAELAADYVGALWNQPCHDCWEEHGDRVHVSTLACLYAGLRAAAELLNRRAYASLAEAVRDTVRRDGVRDGRLTKWLGGDGVDASLLWAATPFGLLDAHDAVMQATLAEIERRCVDSSGGVHRYPTDTYYGGGAWLLLTAMLGWHFARLDRRTDALHCLRWVEARADAAGMPEQVADHVYDPSQLTVWKATWGESAHPLLWSHAMHLVLLEETRSWTGR